MNDIVAEMWSLPLGSWGMGVAFWLVLAGLWGLLWGSFSNVVIARLPQGQSVVSPPSTAPCCDSKIRAWQNIPVVSWVVLRGRCASCGARIPWRYLLVELLGGFLSVLAFVYVAGGVSFWRIWEVPGGELLLMWVLLSFMLFFLLQIAWIDGLHALIPHVLSGGLALLGVVFSWWYPSASAWRTVVFAGSVPDAVLGFSIGWGSLFVVAFVYELLTGRRGIGGGDLMLFGALGAWFGAYALPVIMLLATVVAILSLLLAALFRREVLVDASAPGFWGAEDASPPDADPPESRAPQLRPGARYGVSFGPFLCISGALYLLAAPFYARWLVGL